MALEAVMYFVLGFLSAGLLALMVSPAIWNRAVLLTKRKIESSVPLTLNEVQADKDQLRAEFAMSTRRLEMNIEELRKKAAEQVIQIDRKRDELNKLGEDSTERRRTIEELEAKASELRAKLTERETQLGELSNRQVKLEEEYAATADELIRTRSKLTDNEQELNSKRIELVARDATIDNLNTAKSFASLSEDEKSKKLSQLNRSLTNARKKLEAEKLKTKETEQQVIDARQEAADIVKKLEKRERDLGNTRQASAEDDADMLAVSKQLMEEKSRTVELEARLAKQSLQVEALLNDASNENVQAAMKWMNSEVEKTSKALAESTAECDRLKKELEAVKFNATGEWASDRQENAILRERINDMAAQVAVMTAEMEGGSSKITKLLKGGKKSAGSTGKTGEAAAKEGLTSLAARIRAIQETAGSGRQ